MSRENLDAIRYFTEQGGRFAVATGRTQKNCAPYMKGLAINTPCIFYNGAALYDWKEQRFIKTRYLESPALPDFVKACMSACPKLCVQIYTEETLHVVNDPANDDRIMLAERQEFKRSRLADLIHRNWIKLLLCDDRENLMKCKAFSVEYGLDDTANHFFSSPVYLEFVGKQVSKGHMLGELMTLEGCRGKKIVAAGDFHNDIEMLRRADCGIAPSNAQPEVRAVADIVAVSHDEHLLQHIIDKIIPGM